MVNNKIDFLTQFFPKMHKTTKCEHLLYKKIESMKKIVHLFLDHFTSKAHLPALDELILPKPNLQFHPPYNPLSCFAIFQISSRNFPSVKWMIPARAGIPFAISPKISSPTAQHQQVDTWQILWKQKAMPGPKSISHFSTDDTCCFKSPPSAFPGFTQMKEWKKIPKL